MSRRSNAEERGRASVAQSRTGRLRKLNSTMSTSQELQERHEYDIDSSAGRHVKSTTIAGFVTASDLGYSSSFRSKTLRLSETQSPTGKKLGPGQYDPEFLLDNNGKPRRNPWIKPTFSPQNNRTTRDSTKYMLPRSDRGASVSPTNRRGHFACGDNMLNGNTWASRSMRSAGDFTGIAPVLSEAPDVFYDTHETLADDVRRSPSKYAAGFVSTTERLASLDGQYHSDDRLAKRREQKLQQHRSRQLPAKPKEHLSTIPPDYYHDGVKKQKDMAEALQRKWNARYKSATFCSNVARQAPVIKSLAQKPEDGWGRLKYDDRWGATNQVAIMGSLFCR